MAAQGDIRLYFICRIC